MLSLTSLNTHYGQAHILRDVSFAVGPGECVALLGRNGAGKSTTLKTVMGLVKATSGRILYRERDVCGLAPYRRARLGLGYVPEDRRIFGRLSVLENLLAAEGASRKGLRSWTVPRVFKLFPALESLADRQADRLSGGEQQMLAVGRTLMGNPECLLLDEPTEGLAPLVVEQVLAAIEVLKQEGLSILLSEQNHKTARKAASRVLVLEKGTLLYDGEFGLLSQRAKEALGL